MPAGDGWRTFTAWAFCCCPACVTFRYTNVRYDVGSGLESFPDYDASSIYAVGPYQPPFVYSPLDPCTYGCAAHAYPPAAGNFKASDPIAGSFLHLRFHPAYCGEFEQPNGFYVDVLDPTIGTFPGTLYTSDLAAELCPGTFEVEFSGASYEYTLQVIFGPCPCDKGMDCFCCGITDSYGGFNYVIITMEFTGEDCPLEGHSIIFGLGWSPATQEWIINGGSKASGGTEQSILLWAPFGVYTAPIRLYAKLTCGGVLSGRIYLLDYVPSSDPPVPDDPYPPDADELLCSFSVSVSADEDCNISFTVECGDCTINGTGSASQPSTPYYLYVMQEDIRLDENAGAAELFLPHAGGFKSFRLFQVGASTVWAGTFNAWTWAVPPFVPAPTTIRLEITFDTSDNSVAVAAFDEATGGSTVALYTGIADAVLVADPLVLLYNAINYTPVPGALFDTATVYYPNARIYEVVP